MKPTMANLFRYRLLLYAYGRAAYIAGIMICTSSLSWPHSWVLSDRCLRISERDFFSSKDCISYPLLLTCPDATLQQIHTPCRMTSSRRPNMTLRSQGHHYGFGLGRWSKVRDRYRFRSRRSIDYRASRSSRYCLRPHRLTRISRSGS
jgi:hypothetical protein